MTREIAIQIAEGLAFLSFGVFYFGWARITEYSPRVRTIVFWIINILGGIFILDYIIVAGCHISWGYVCLMAGAAAFGFWLGEKYPKHPDARIQRRGIISVWEDFVLFMNAIVIWFGIPFLWVQILAVFCEKAP